MWKPPVRPSTLRDGNSALRDGEDGEAAEKPSIEWRSCMRTTGAGDASMLAVKWEGRQASRFADGDREMRSLATRKQVATERHHFHAGCEMRGDDDDDDERMAAGCRWHRDGRTGMGAQGSEAPQHAYPDNMTMTEVASTLATCHEKGGVIRMGGDAAQSPSARA